MKRTTIAILVAALACAPAIAAAAPTPPVDPSPATSTQRAPLRPLADIPQLALRDQAETLRDTDVRGLADLPAPGGVRCLRWTGRAYEPSAC